MGPVGKEKFVVIDTATSGTEELVAAVASKKLRVTNYTAVAAGAVTLKFEDEDGTALTGAMALAANGDRESHSDDFGLFETPVGKGLHTNLGGAVQVSGHLGYVEIN